jgi:hypothetical protein
MPEDSKSKDAAEVVVTEAQAAPEIVGEGPTVTKWEEWVSRSVLLLPTSAPCCSILSSNAPAHPLSPYPLPR